MEKDLDLLRLFGWGAEKGDLVANLEGEPIWKFERWVVYEKALLTQIKPPNRQEIVDSSFLRMPPLFWLEGRPVYEKWTLICKPPRRCSGYKFVVKEIKGDFVFNYRREMTHISFLSWPENELEIYEGQKYLKL